MAQTRPTQRPPARTGANREQSRRGLAAPASGQRPQSPLTAAGAGGRRRGGASIIGFVRDTRSELRKVVWPTRRETINLTVVVVALSVAVGLLLGGFDFIFQELFRYLLEISGNGGF